MSRAGTAGLTCLFLAVSASHAADATGVHPAAGPHPDIVDTGARPSSRASVEATVALIDAGLTGTPAVVPVMAAATSDSRPSADVPSRAGADRIVEIDGRRWRRAPEGTPDRGAPGTRIILDDEVYLDVEKASASEFLPRRSTSRRAAAATPGKEVSESSRDTSQASARTRATPDSPEPVEQAKAEPRRTAPLGAPSIAAAMPVEEDGDDVIEQASAQRAAADRTAYERTAARREAAAIADAKARSDREDEQRRTAALEAAAGNVGSDASDEGLMSPIMNALRMPATARPSSREFGYVDAMPVSYDFGGAGLLLEGSASMRGRFRALARLGAAADYQELLLGGSWYVTPPRADRMTLAMTAGVETGRFELERGSVATELADTGFYLGAESRFVINNRFELQAGVGYSSFFEGDPVAFGGAFLHVGRRLDIISRVEVGDNDSLGIGVRYYY